MADAWEAQDFATLESLANKYVDPAARTASGKRLLAIYENALDACISIQSIEVVRKDLTQLAGTKPDNLVRERSGPPSSRYPEIHQKWALVEHRIARWAEQYPMSPNPIIAKAIYLTNKAHFFRGNGWAKDVNKDAWPIFEANLEAARNLLKETRPISQKNPMWFSTILNTLGPQSTSRTEIDTLVWDTLEHGQGYPPALQSAFNYMQPRWGGSYASMSRFAKIANRQTEAEEGGGIYARLYLNFVGLQMDEANSTFFQRTGTDWSLLSQSFEKIIRKYPEPRNYSGYALFACMAGDSQKVQQLLHLAGTRDYTKMWPKELARSCGLLAPDSGV